MVYLYTPPTRPSDSPQVFEFQINAQRLPPPLAELPLHKLPPGLRCGCQHCCGTSGHWAAAASEVDRYTYSHRGLNLEI